MIREHWMEQTCPANRSIFSSLKLPEGATEIPKNQSRESEIVNLLKQVNSTITKGGSVLIPVFALGRMQEMLFVLDEAFQKSHSEGSGFLFLGWAWI